MRAIAAILLLLLSSSVFAGYDLHITRKQHWADKVGPAISIAEWRHYVESDSQITSDKENDQFTFVVSLPSERFPLLYDPRSGELFTKNHSAAAVQKLKEIAGALRAHVQGDDGELYKSP